ncbi:MAG: hypothetical protein IT379_39025 [Deltaproteobacteria bacterium]|nr:hypothetical protein [Deltaproteobacteria bacterium]
MSPRESGRVARPTWTRRAGSLALAAAAVLGVARCTCADPQAEADRRRREQQSARAERTRAGLARESRTLTPEVIRGVELGMTVESLTKLRPRARSTRADRRPAKRGTDDHDWLQEDLSSAARALYAFDEEEGRLVQVQVLSLVPSREAIAPHLTAMNEQYGSPTGAWDCPRTAELPPTRRFTWRRAFAAVQDVILIYQGRVSITFYLAPAQEIERSLRRARCVPISGDRVGQMPVADELPEGALPARRSPPSRSGDAGS